MYTMKILFLFLLYMTNQQKRYRMKQLNCSNTDLSKRIVPLQTKTWHI